MNSAFAVIRLKKREYPFIRQSSMIPSCKNAFDRHFAEVLHAIAGYWMENISKRILLYSGIAISAANKFKL
jgi:hypothetical protein